MTKPELYAQLADDLAPFWYRDSALLERNPDKWRLARAIDDLLVRSRDNTRVSQGSYARTCQKLRDLYAVGPQEARNEPRANDLPSDEALPSLEAEDPQTAIVDDLEDQ